MVTLISTARAAFQQSCHLLHSFLLFTHLARCFCTPWENPITSDNLTKSLALICKKLASSIFQALMKSRCSEMSASNQTLECISIILCLKVTDEFHMRPYGHKKKVCLDQNISIGSFHISFHNVSMYVKWLQKLEMNHLFVSGNIYLVLNLMKSSFWAVQPPGPLVIL